MDKIVGQTWLTCLGRTTISEVVSCTYNVCSQLLNLARYMGRSVRTQLTNIIPR